MAKAKFDIVVEAVHYGPNGQVEWVRAYRRRGPVFSDRQAIDRQTLVELLKAGQRTVAGRRVPQMGATFEVRAPIRLVQVNGNEVLVAGDTRAEHDNLAGVPAI